MNRRCLPWILATVGLFCTVAEAAALSKPSEAELAAITTRGVLLAEYDTAAWQATDAVKAAHPVESRMGRYIARKTNAGWVADFGRLNEAGDKFLVAYEAVQTVSLSKYEVKCFDPAREDTGWNLAAAKGIENAVRDFKGADRPYNMAVLPAEHEGIYVYLYPAQVKEGVYPIGGDARYRVSPDGTKIIERRQMHKAVIESIPSSAPGKVASGYHTHILSDLPEDTDVLLVLTRRPRVPEMVGAGEYTFTINIDGKITVSDLPR